MTGDYDEPPRFTSHRDRYEGWTGDAGDTVRRFDKQDFRWVLLDIADIPSEIVDERRS